MTTISILAHLGIRFQALLDSNPRVGGTVPSMLELVAVFSWFAIALVFGLGSANSAGATELVVVGLHVPIDQQSVDGEAQVIAEARRLSGFEVIGPDEVKSRLRGRGSRLVDEALQARGRDMLSEGRVLFDHADLESAQERIAGAVSVLESAMAGSTDGRHLIDALLVQGNIGLAMGNLDAARAAYKRVVQLDPDRVLDPVHHPPKVVDLYMDVRDAVRQVPDGIMDVISSDPSASVIVNGRLRGQGSITLRDMVAGTHHVLITGSNGHREYRRVEVRPKQRVEVSVLLDRFFIGQSADVESERAKQAARLYRALGDQVTEGLVLMGGQLGIEEVGIQLYEPRTGNFSRVLREEVGADPIQSISGLVAQVGTMRSTQGMLSSEAVSTDQLPIDIGSNPTLARVLFAPIDSPPAVASKPKVASPIPWPIWAGIGTVVAGGVLTAILVKPSENQTPVKRVPNDTGTVVVHF